jgi:hypothetical protein
VGGGGVAHRFADVLVPTLRTSTAKRHGVGRRIVEMGGETRRRRRAKILRASVILLASWLILYAASACAKTVPGQAYLGAPSGSAAWIDANALPLKDSEHWPDLASRAQPLTDGAFGIQSLCRVASDTRFFKRAQSARARIDRGANTWSLQQQIVHYGGDPWRTGQLAWALFDSLVEAVRNCESSAVGTHVDITTAESKCKNVKPCSQFAATIDVPLNQVVAHVYLSTVGSSVTELSLWSSPTPSRPWSAPSDAEIFAAVNSRLCMAWPCG